MNFPKHCRLCGRSNARWFFEFTFTSGTGLSCNACHDTYAGHPFLRFTGILQSLDDPAIWAPGPNGVAPFTPKEESEETSKPSSPTKPALPFPPGSNSFGDFKSTATLYGGGYHDYPKPPKSGTTFGFIEYSQPKYESPPSAR